MKISFFKNGYIALNEDHSYTPPETIDGVTIEAKGHQDCLFCRDIDFDPNTQKISFDPETQEVKVEAIPGIERAIVFNKIISWESNDLQGYEFSDIEIGDIITARIFDGNPYAQMVLQAKATEAMFRKIEGKATPEDLAILAKKDQVMTALNQIRALFSLSPM